jgi:putative salt-induced outer membrane protein
MPAHAAPADARHSAARRVRFAVIAGSDYHSRAAAAAPQPTYWRTDVPKKLILAATLLLPLSLQAQTEPFTGRAALGYLATSGNTESTNANATFEAEYSPGEIWHYLFNANAVGASTGAGTTAEAYWAGAKAQRDFNEFDYLFASVDWKKDRFSGYEEQLSESIGYGRRILNSDRHTLSAEGGVGARQSTLSTGIDQNETIVRGALDYVLTISETSQFTQRVLLEIGDENTFSESSSKLSARIINDIAVVLSYTIRNNSDVPVGRENRDTFTSIALEYTF